VWRSQMGHVRIGCAVLAPHPHSNEEGSRCFRGDEEPQRRASLGDATLSTTVLRLYSHGSLVNRIFRLFRTQW